MTIWLPKVVHSGLKEVSNRRARWMQELILEGVQMVLEKEKGPQQVVSQAREALLAKLTDPKLSPRK